MSSGHFQSFSAQGLFRDLLDARRVTLRQAVLHFQHRIDCPVCRGEPLLVHHPSHHEVAADVPEPQFPGIRLAVSVQVEHHRWRLLFDRLDPGALAVGDDRAAAPRRPVADDGHLCRRQPGSPFRSFDPGIPRCRPDPGADELHLEEASGQAANPAKQRRRTDEQISRLEHGLFGHSRIPCAGEEIGRRFLESVVAGRNQDNAPGFRRGCQRQEYPDSLADPRIGVVGIAQAAAALMGAGGKGDRARRVAVAEQCRRLVGGEASAAQRLEIAAQNRVFPQRLKRLAMRRRPLEHSLIPPGSVNRLVAGCYLCGREHLRHMEKTRHVESIILVCVHFLFPFSDMTLLRISTSRAG